MTEEKDLKKNGIDKVKAVSLSLLLLVMSFAVPMTALSTFSSPLDITNEAPVADAGEDITSVYLNEVVMLNGTLSTDEEIDNCTWVWESTSHSGIELSPENSSTPSFTIEVEETITFMLTLKDPSGLESTDEVDVLVEVNTAPRITVASPSPSGSEGPFYERSKPIEFSANGTTDTEVGADDLEFEWVSNISGTLGSEKYFITIINELGWHEITLNVTDPHGGISEEIFNIKIREDPFAPEASIYLRPSRPDLQYAKSEIISLDASGTTDSNSFDTLETMNFTWMTNQSGGMVLGYGPIVNTTLSEGHHNITLDVVDTDGLTDSDFIELVSFNSPPEAHVQAPDVKLRGSIPTVNVSEEAEFTGFYSSDPDEDDLSFNWDLGDGNVAVGETVSYSWSQWGTFNITLTVNDGSTYENLDTVEFKISINSIPVAMADQGLSVEVGESLSITANGSYDDDGDQLTYRWDFDGDGRFDSSRDEVSWKFNVEGTHTVLLQVSDGFAFSEVTTEVQVFFPNEAPTAAITNVLIDDQLIVPLSGGRGEIELDASPSIDPDDDTDGDGEINGREENNLTYTWDLDISDDSDDDGIPDNDADETGDTVKVKIASSSTLRVKLNVSDPRGKYDTLEIPLKGNHPPESLSIKVGPTTKVLTGAQVTLTASASDEDRSDRNKLEYFWDFGDGEASTTSNFQGRHTYFEEGTYEVTLTVSDTLLETSTKSSVTVVDMDPPQISYPSEGSEVSGVVTLSGRIREVRLFEVDKVEIKVGDKDWKTAEGTTQWSYDLDTTKLANGDIVIQIRYTVNDAEPIEAELEITVNVKNTPEAGFDWLPLIVGGIILLVIIVILMFVFRRKPRRWEQILPPPGPGQRMPPMVAPGGLPPAQTRTSLPPTGAQPPKTEEAPKQAEPPAPEEEGPKQIRIKCPACTKVFKITDNGERPLHINCKHCGANGVIDQVPGSEEEPKPEGEEEPVEEEKVEEAPPEPIPIVCPSCDNLFELDEETDTAKCPICGAEGDLDEGTISILKERFGPGKDEELTLKCPSCTGTFKVLESDGAIICPYCGAKGKPSG